MATLDLSSADQRDLTIGLAIFFSSIFLTCAWCFAKDLLPWRCLSHCFARPISVIAGCFMAAAASCKLCVAEARSDPLADPQAVARVVGPGEEIEVKEVMTAEEQRKRDGTLHGSAKQGQGHHEEEEGESGKHHQQHLIAAKVVPMPMWDGMAETEIGMEKETTTGGDEGEGGRHTKVDVLSPTSAPLDPPPPSVHPHAARPLYLGAGSHKHTTAAAAAAGGEEQEKQQTREGRTATAGAEAEADEARRHIKSIHIVELSPETREALLAVKAMSGVAHTGESKRTSRGSVAGGGGGGRATSLRGSAAPSAPSSRPGSAGAANCVAGNSTNVEDGDHEAAPHLPGSVPSPAATAVSAKGLPLNWRLSGRGQHGDGQQHGEGEGGQHPHPLAPHTSHPASRHHNHHHSHSHLGHADHAAGREEGAVAEALPLPHAPLVAIEETPGAPDGGGGGRGREEEDEDEKPPSTPGTPRRSE